MDSLFPEMPKDLKALSDDDLQALLDESVEAASLIDKDDEAFLTGLSAEEIITEYKAGAENIKQIREEQKARVDAHENFVAEKEKIKAELEVKAESSDEDEADEEEAASDDESEEEASEEADEEASAEAEDVSELTEKEPVLVAASEGTSSNADATVTITESVMEKPRLRRPPAPAAERVVVTPEPEEKGAALVAAGEMSLRFKDDLNPSSLAEVVLAAANHHGPHPKVDPVGKYRFGGPEHKIAHADFVFPDDRHLTNDVDANMEKIKAIGTPFFGPEGVSALTASGGLCAPATPFYSMPNFASDAEPVWDALPVFQADRGAVNVPEATIIGDITTAISSISEENDALGGTFATKSCQDLSCPSYTETAVQILAHCREYGNLNARSWPEKIAHENALTMAALSQTSENFMLERIKALSVNVSNGAATLSALSYLVEAITRARWGIRGRLRMPNGVRFRALLPVVMIDMLLLDTVQTIDGNRFKTREDLAAYLNAIGIDVVWYMDGNFAAGDDMVPDASQTAAAIDPWPNTFQWAIYPEGAFLGIDMGVLELGIVRDSTLNSTNDFQVFGERFRNLVRIGPAQSAYWVTSTLCANGTFPPAGTQRTCEN